MRRFAVFCCAALLEFVISAGVAGQQVCPTPALPAIDHRANIFNAQQEMDLGDALAEQIQRDFLVIDDPELTGHLQSVGDGLLRSTQTNGMRVRFFLFDLPVANAFSLPGGRVYVSRKMVSFLHDESELASVLGHELGHILAQQPAMEMTRAFREVLGVNEVGGREDIFQKYSMLQDNLAKKKKALSHSEGKEQQEQLVADQIGLQLTANAGYPTQKFADFFDRLAQTKGKTGSWLTDLFGGTKPESRRLREMIKTAGALAASCSGRPPEAAASEFGDWRTEVLNYSGLGHKERVHGVQAKVILNPPLARTYTRCDSARMADLHWHRMSPRSMCWSVSRWP